MDLFTQFLHLLNFMAPAAGTALGMSLLGRVWRRKAGFTLPFWAVWCLQFVVGLACLLVGLWGFGRDGKMATYGLLVLAAASCQWVLMRGWRH